MALRKGCILNFFLFILELESLHAVETREPWTGASAVRAPMRSWMHLRGGGQEVGTTHTDVSLPTTLPTHDQVRVTKIAKGMEVD